MNKKEKFKTESNPALIPTITPIEEQNLKEVLPSD